MVALGDLPDSLTVRSVHLSRTSIVTELVVQHPLRSSPTQPSHPMPKSSSCLHRNVVKPTADLFDLVLLLIVSRPTAA